VGGVWKGGGTGAHIRVGLQIERRRIAEESDVSKKNRGRKGAPRD